MHNRLRFILRFILLSALLFGTFVLSFGLVPQAFAVPTTSHTASHVATTSSNAVISIAGLTPYERGYREGYSQGYRDAVYDCGHHRYRSATAPTPREAGYADGYSAGYNYARANDPACTQSGPTPYEKGYREGYRQGYNDAVYDCQHPKSRRFAAPTSREAGYADGYSAGYSYARAHAMACTG